MTKKRFIKLMMAQGYERNKAVQVAKAVSSIGYSYQEAHSLLLGPLGIKKLVEAAQHELNKFADFMSKCVVPALCEWCSRVVEVFNGAFSEFQNQESFAVCQDPAEEGLPGILENEEQVE